MTVRARTTRVLAALALAATTACGGGAGQASPTPIPATSSEAPASATASAAPSRLPATFDAAAVAAVLPGLDPEYVRRLAYAVAVNDPAAPAPDRPLQRWAGGPFHHCFGEGLDVEQLQAVADEMTVITGIPQTTAGPCNVTWAINPELYGTTEAARTIAGGTAEAILSARVEFSVPYYQNRARHESGHVLGLGHSPRMGDVMYPNGTGQFSAEELRVLRLMYVR